MDERVIEEFATTLGFGRAVSLFREDVIAAARRAERQRAELDPPDDPAVEPWPPMRVPVTDARP